MYPLQRCCVLQWKVAIMSNNQFLHDSSTTIMWPRASLLSKSHFHHTALQAKLLLNDIDTRSG